MLSLTSSDRKQLQTALRELTSPLAHADVDAWRAAVTATVSTLVSADIGSFVLPVDGRSHMYSDGFDSSVADAFPELAPRLPAVSVWHRQIELGVWSRAALYDEYLAEYFRTEYFNDYIVPARAFDSIGITVPLADRIESHTSAGILYHHDRENVPAFGERGLELLGLLKPAFEAGVDAHFRLFRYRERLGKVIDSTGEAILLLDGDGRELHRTPALNRLLADKGEGEHVLAEARLTGLPICGWLPASYAVMGRPAAQSIQTTEARYHIRATRADGESGGSEALVVVTIQRAGPSRPDPHQLKSEFGLTRRQCDVALLLAEGRSNPEIARKLFISPHTARHHTEQVLSKLGVTSRAAVGARLCENSV